ncbi:cysteine proteinase [Sistotremastrum suecicum HHB10207 ss-3]|uniref:Ubiquitin carboxyl-terminal hydrolase n=1 Tax=Sistotremastrum suecicum HHB10207 ss-3 TaxID=1314776 RepID=A0A166J1H5_9AGAM|nr:cysteine proteinase [Sistotremastrum suecicum HHB10207 ss-3]
MTLLRWMGVAPSSATPNVPQQAKPPVINGADFKQFGLENFGNTCYINAVVQALYFCPPFRELVCNVPDRSIPPPPSPAPVNIPLPLSPPPAQVSPAKSPLFSPARAPFRRRESILAPTESSDHQPNAAPSDPAPSGPPIPTAPPTLFSALRSLFMHISQNPQDKGKVSPTAFVKKVKEENELFRNSDHQDAHELLNYLLNKIIEDLEHEGNVSREDLSASIGSLITNGNGRASSDGSSGSSNSKTLVHSLFEGTLTSETRCLTCETVSSRDESFLDLSIDIEQNSSVTACLRQFSASEMLCQRNKFFCDSCCGLQEAEKRMKIKTLPNVLALHLKRFKYQEDVRKYIKLAYRVAFPFELRLFNTVDDAIDPDRLYKLFAIVVHIGGGPNHGHYTTIVKSRGSWLVFDDEVVGTIKESEIPKYFGESNVGAGYVLFYQAVDLDPVSLGLSVPTPPVSVPQSTPLPSEQRSVSDEGDGDGDGETDSTGASAGPQTPSVSAHMLPSPARPQKKNSKVDLPAVLDPPVAPEPSPGPPNGTEPEPTGLLARTLRHTRSNKFETNRTSLHNPTLPTIPSTPTKSSNGDASFSKEEKEVQKGAGWFSSRRTARAKSLKVTPPSKLTTLPDTAASALQTRINTLHIPGQANGAMHNGTDSMYPPSPTSRGNDSRPLSALGSSESHGREEPHTPLSTRPLQSSLTFPLTAPTGGESGTGSQQSEPLATSNPQFPTPSQRELAQGSESAPLSPPTTWTEERGNLSPRPSAGTEAKLTKKASRKMSLSSMPLKISGLMRRDKE